MLRPSPKLEEIDRRHARERLARRSYAEALEVFSALWREAAALDATFPGPWRDDIGPDRVDEIIDAARAAGLRVLPDEPRELVAESFVLPSEERETGLRVDFIFSTTPYETQAIDRAVRVEVRDESVPFAAVPGREDMPEEVEALRRKV